MVERLLDQPSVQLHEIYKPRGFSGLHEAALCGQLQVLQLLLMRQADLQQVDANGSSALFHAVTSNQLEVRMSGWLKTRGWKMGEARKP